MEDDKDTEKEGKKKELMWTEVQLAHKKVSMALL